MRRSAGARQRPTGSWGGDSGAKNGHVDRGRRPGPSQPRWPLPLANRQVALAGSGAIAPHGSDGANRFDVVCFMTKHGIVLHRNAIRGSRRFADQPRSATNAPANGSAIPVSETDLPTGEDTDA